VTMVVSTLVTIGGLEQALDLSSPSLTVLELH